MKKLLIFTEKPEQNKELIENLSEKIASSGNQSELVVSASRDVKPFQNLNTIDAILAVGGDGTLIDAANAAFGSNVPLVGINRGHTGYLCDLDDSTAMDAIDVILNDDYELEKHMMLTGFIMDSDQSACDITSALNDIVIRSSGSTNMIVLKVYVNGKYLYEYPCDGMIFSTPTGSTAYNLSAHGPIVNPKTSLIVLTPINPHTLNSRSIILDMDDEITVEITRHHLDLDESADIFFDGGHMKKLLPGQKVVVKRAGETTTMIRLDSLNFLQRIRTKLQAL